MSSSIKNRSGLTRQNRYQGRWWGSTESTSTSAELTAPAKSTAWSTGPSEAWLSKTNCAQCTNCQNRRNVTDASHVYPPEHSDGSFT